MSWMWYLDRSLEKLRTIYPDTTVDRLIRLRQQRLRTIRIGATTGFLTEEEGGCYAIEAPCHDQIELERTIFHEFAHWIDAMLHETLDHGEEWRKIVTALGYPEEVVREDELNGRRQEGTHETS